MFEKLKKRKSKLPEFTGRVIDFTTTSWGHNLEGAHPDKEGTWHGHCWLTPSPSVGDEVIWLTNYGKAHSIITEVHSYNNVDDMFYVHGVVVRREVNDA